MKTILEIREETILSRVCVKCGKTKTKHDFRTQPHGDGYRTTCKECSVNKSKRKAHYEANKESIKAKRKKYYEENKSKIKSTVSDYRKANPEKIKSCAKSHRESNKEKIAKAKRTARNNNFEKAIYTQAKRRAALKGIEFNISLNDIIIPEMCPLLGVPFIPGTKNNYKYTPSIDRVDNTKGYIKGNIRIITMLANSMKNSASEKELLNFSKNIMKYVNDEDISQSTSEGSEGGKIKNLP